MREFWCHHQKGAPHATRGFDTSRNLTGHSLRIEINESPGRTSQPIVDEVPRAGNGTRVTVESVRYRHDDGIREFLSQSPKGDGLSRSKTRVPTLNVRGICLRFL